MTKNSFPNKAEVVIIGAGPAGSTLAYQLARLGVDVVLVDKAKFPRGKPAGEGSMSVPKNLFLLTSHP